MSVQLEYDDLYPYVGKTLTVRKDNRGNLYLDCEGKNVIYMEADAYSQLRHKDEFVTELMSYDDIVIADFTGKTEDEVQDHESDGTLGDIIAAAYDAKTPEERDAFITHYEMNRRLLS